MQKKLLTAAVASVLAAPCIALAQTAASVEVYGTVYPTFGHVKYGDGFTARDTNVSTGALVPGIVTVPSMSKFDVQAPSSNFGVRGRESLGGGLTAWFQIEQNAPLEREDTQSVTVSSRNSAAGLQGGFGNVFVGQWTTPWADLDSLCAFGQVSVLGPVTSLIGRRESTGVAPNPAQNKGGALGSCTTSIIPPGGFAVPAAGTLQCDAVVASGGVGHAFWKRASDMIRYTSPAFSGLTFDAMYQVPELKSVGVSSGVNYTAEPSMYSTSLKWSGMGGRARVGAVIDRHKDFTSIGKTDTGYAVKGGFNFGVVDIGAAYENMTYKCGKFNSTAAQGGPIAASATAGTDLPTLCAAEGDVKSKVWSVAGSVPVGIGAIKAFYAKASSMTGVIGVGSTGAKEWGLGYDHRFSKRTSVGVEYTKIDNERNAQFTWTGMAPTQTGASNTPVFGSSVTWVFVGMVHRF